jgi:hypothetical protein
VCPDCGSLFADPGEKLELTERSSLLIFRPGLAPGFGINNSGVGPPSSLVVAPGLLSPGVISFQPEWSVGEPDRGACGYPGSARGIRRPIGSMHQRRFRGVCSPWADVMLNNAQTMRLRTVHTTA